MRPAALGNITGYGTVEPRSVPRENDRRLREADITGL